MGDMVGMVLFMVAMFGVGFMFYGDPDLWDKALLVSHQWADAQLVQ